MPDLGHKGEDDALCVNDSRLAKVVNASTTQDLSSCPEPDWLWEVDALVSCQQLGCQAAQSSQHCLQHP